MYIYTFICVYVYSFMHNFLDLTSYIYLYTNIRLIVEIKIVFNGEESVQIWNLDNIKKLNFPKILNECFKIELQKKAIVTKKGTRETINCNQLIVWIKNKELF